MKSRNYLSYLTLSVFLLFSSFCFGAGLNTVCSLEYFNIAMDIDSIYKIKKSIDLAGKTLELPQGVVLDFSCLGNISNGSIVGKGNSIKGSTRNVFDNVEIKGSWIVENISSGMFKNCSDERLLSNITNLSSGSCYNRITIEEAIHVEIPLWTSYLTLKSNTDLYIMANIMAKPSQHKGGWLITIKGENIRVFGGGNILQGDVLEQQNNKPECLHAIFVDRCSKNIVVDNLIMQYFWGDGISSQGSNVVYKNLEMRYNGRQGITLTNGKNIEISNCYFHDMGGAGINEDGGPGAGIDVEPGNDMIVDDVVIYGCTFTNNYKYMYGYVNDLEIYNTKSINLTIDSCVIGGLYLGYCENVQFKNTTLKEPIFFVNEQVSKMTMINCSMTDDIYAKAKKHQSVIFEGKTNVFNDK